MARFAAACNRCGRRSQGAGIVSTCLRIVLAFMALSGISQLGAQTINVKSYGAIGDMKTTTTATCTAGSAAVSVSSTFFTAGDVGKLIELSGCGISGTMLWTSIAAVIDGMHATLATAASTSVAASKIDVGTDNSLTLQAALDAAV